MLFENVQFNFSALVIFFLRLRTFLKKSLNREILEDSSDLKQ